MCIGETLEERTNGNTFEVLERQLRVGLNNIDKSYAEKIVIAYEPVWAIGTGVSAEIYQVQEAHEYIRKLLFELFGDAASNMVIQYGGSVNEKNALSILELPDVNGALIGGASLKADTFMSIIMTAQEILG
jgi:triosephosphate isomerase (TIM)